MLHIQKLHKSYSSIKDTQPFCTNPGHLGGTLGTSRNCSRVVHLGWELQFQRKMRMEINMPKRSQTAQKLNTYQTYSTLLHQPGTPWGHTRDIQKLFQGGTLGVGTTISEEDENGN